MEKAINIWIVVANTAYHF